MDTEILHVKCKNKPAEVMSLEHINQLLLSGELSGDELAWKPGMATWATLLTIPGIVFPTIPPPLPPEYSQPFLKRVKSAIFESYVANQQVQLIDPLNLPSASKYRRALALVLDVGLLIGIIVVTEDFFVLNGSSFWLYSSWGIFAAYLLLKDGLFKGASLGKLVFRLVVVDINTGYPCGIIRSSLRNGLPIVTIIGVILLGWVISLIIGSEVASKAGAAGLFVCVGSLCASLRSPDGRTICDKFAGTYVLNASAYQDAFRACMQK